MHRFWRALLLSFLVLLALAVASAAQSTPPKRCDCRYKQAYSRSNSGVCSVNEDMSSSCELRWGAEPGDRRAAVDPGTDPRVVLEEAQRAAAASMDPNSIDRLAAMGAGDLTFWNNVAAFARETTGAPESD